MEQVAFGKDRLCRRGETCQKFSFYPHPENSRLEVIRDAEPPQTAPRLEDGASGGQVCWVYSGHPFPVLPLICLFHDRYTDFLSSCP